MSKQQLEFDLIIVPDEKNGQFTAFFAQFPKAMAVGETIEEAEKRAFEITKTMLSDISKESIIAIGDHTYTQKSVNAELFLNK